MSAAASMSLTEALAWALQRIRTSSFGEGEYFARAEEALQREAGNTAPMPTTIATSVAAIAAAFEAWERDCRADPGGFYTAAEIAAMEVATLSEERAIHLMALLRRAQRPLLDTTGGRDTSEKLVSDLAGVSHACAGVELHPLGFAPFGEIVRVNVHADNPATFCLESFAADVGCRKPLIVGPMEFVTVFEHRAQPVEVLSLEPRHPGGLDLGIHADCSGEVKEAIYTNSSAEVQP